MRLISAKAVLYFENRIYLPMVILILEKDRELFKEGEFKLKRPYVQIVEEALKLVQAELKATNYYLRHNNMKLIRGNTDETFTEYIFMHSGYEDRRRYLNVRLRNRTEELLSLYFSMVKHQSNG